MLRRGGENLAIRFKRELDVLPAEQAEREVETRFDGGSWHLQRATEGVDRSLGIVLVP